MRTHAIVGGLCFTMVGAASVAAADGTLIVLNKAEASASLLGAATGEEIARIPVGVGPHEVAVTPGGATAVVCNYGEQTPGNTLTLIDLAAAAPVKTLTLDGFHRPHGIVILKDGRHALVTAEAEKALIKVDLDTGAVVQSWETRQHVSHMVAVAPDESRAYVSNLGSASLTVIDLGGGADPVIIPTAPGAEGLDVSPDGREIWVGNRDAHTVSIIDAQELKVVAEIESATFPIRVKFTPDGAHVLVSNAVSGDVAVFDARERKEVARVDLRMPGDPAPPAPGQPGAPGPVPIGIVIPPGQGHAYIALSAIGEVAAIELGSWRMTARYKAGKAPDGMGWTAAVPDRE